MIEKCIRCKSSVPTSGGPFCTAYGEHIVRLTSHPKINLEECPYGCYRQERIKFSKCRMFVLRLFSGLYRMIASRKLRKWLRKIARIHNMLRLLPCWTEKDIEDLKHSKLRGEGYQGAHIVPYNVKGFNGPSSNPEREEVYR